MTQLDVGALVGRVVLETATFDRVYARVVRQFSQLGAEAERGAAGVATADEAFVGLTRASSSSVTSVTRSTAAARAAGSAQEKAAVATRQHAMAVTRVADTMAALTAATDRERAATLRALAAQERYDEVLSSGAASTRQLASAQAGLISSQRSVVAAQDAVGASAARTRGSMHGLLGTARDLGLIFGGLELAKQASEFIGAGKDLTTALNGVQAASHATNGQMAAVRQEAIGLGKDLRIPAATAVDAADAMQDLVRSGMTLPRAMAATRSALLLASAAQVSTADGARYLGDILDDFGLSGDKAAHVANVLAGAATAAGGGLGDMFTAMKYAGPIARAAGGNVDELATAIALLAKSGIQGDQAGTGLRSMFLALAGPTKQQTEGFKALGITTKDAAGNLLPLPQLIDQLHAAQERLNPAEFLAAIKHAFGKPATSVVASFAHQGIDGYNRFAARVGSGDVQQYADLMNRGVSASMRQVRKELTAAGIDVYQKVEPAFAAAANWLGQELPVAGHAAANVLGGPLHAAWTALTAVIGTVGDVLGPVIHLLDSPVGGAAAQTVLAMWAAWKGYTIVMAAYQAVRSALIGMQVTAANGLNTMQAYGRGVAGVLAGNTTQSSMTAAVMQADFAKIEAAALAEAAAVDQAAADQAEAYATLVAASDDATATMIANSQNAAMAAQEQAAASAEAAATAAAGAEAAAADIDAAGEAAAVGWTGILGPVGLVAVGLTAAASAFGLFGHSAASNAAEVDTLTAAIQRDSDALGANTRQAIAHALAQGGALDAARKLGLSVSQVTDAALHGGPALAAVNEALGLYMAGSGGARAAARKLYAALNDQNQSVGVAVRHAREEAAATGKATSASNTNSAAHRGNANAAAANAAAVRKLVTAELALINASLAQAQSQDQFLESVRATTQQLKGNNGSLSQNTANGLANRDALLASVQAALSLKDAQDKAGGSTVAHTRTLAGNIASLRAAAIAAGADKGQVDALLTSLHATPREIRSTLKVEDQATPTLNTVHDAINSIPDYKNIVITATNDVGQAVHDAVNSIPSSASGGSGRATGGAIRGPGTATSDSIPAMLSNNEHVMSAREVQGLGGHGAVEAIRAAGRAGQRIPGFASGGAVGRISSALRSAFGLSTNQIAGILGNLQVESRLNPRAYNARENAHGLAQWEGSRWTALQAYARRMGESATGLHAQIGFLVRELHGSGLIPRIKRMSDPRHVAALVDAQYERSSGSTRGAREAAAASFAAGGNGGGGIRHVGGSWIYNGIRYASRRAALNAQTRASRNETDSTATRVTNAIGKVGHTASPPFQVGDVGYKTISRQIRAAQAALDNAHLSAKARRRLQADINHLTDLAFRQEHHLKVKISGSDMRAVRAAIHGTVADARAAFSTLLHDMRMAGATAKQLQNVRWEDEQFIKAQRAENAAKARLGQVKDYTSSIKQTLGGTFDPTGYGSITDLEAGLGGQTDKNNAYAKEVSGLEAKASGIKGLSAFIHQLEASGQTTTLQTLFGASRAELANVGKDVRGYQLSLSAGGDAAAHAKYGVTQSQQQAKVDRFHKGLEQIAGAIGHMADGLTHEKATIVLGNGQTLDAHITRRVDARLGHLTTAISHGHKKHR